MGKKVHPRLLGLGFTLRKGTGARASTEEVNEIIVLLNLS